MHNVIVDRTEKTENDRDAARLADTIAENLRKSLFSEYYVRSVSVDTLGHGARVHLLICLDRKETWANGILQNSRYGRFSLDVTTGRLEMFSGGYKCAKFRRCKVDLASNASTGTANKILAWISASDAEMP